MSENAQAISSQPVATEIDAGTAQPPANPLRRIILVTLITLLVLFAYHVLSDRYTPYSSQARVETFLTQVSPEVAGDVLEVGVKDNSAVRKGQLLFRIDPRPFQAEVDRLAAQLKRAHTQSVLAASNRDRGNQLIAKHVIAQQDYDQLEAAATSSRDDIGAAEAALAAARLNLDFTQVRSPIDGRVSRMLITPGNLVAITSVLTTVVSDNPVYAYFDADEQTYLRFSRNGAGGASPVYMGLADEQGYEHEGRLDFVDNQVDAKSGTIRARAVFDNRDGHFTPGLFARIKLVGAQAHDTILIDERAVGTDLGKKFVLALKKDNTLEYRPVVLGANIDGLRVVNDGLAAGDVIVVNGLQHVRPGATVTPQRVTMQANGAVAQLAPAPVEVASNAAGANGATLN